MIGTSINERYRLDEEIGQGGMGVVFRAHDTALQRDVAVKLLSKTNLGTEGQGRLLREAQTIAQLDHPNIVAVYDVGQHQGNPFIVMQLVDGGTLHQKRPQELDETLEIIKQICAALDHAHSQGIIHRDLKPENVALAEDGTAKLMDFGLARSVTSRLTSEGTIVGTVHYMAPEQALGQDLDARTDLYALGVMLYELTTGRLPFEGESPVAVITQHLNAPVVPPASIRQDLPPYLDKLILKLLEKDPDNRTASAGAVLLILESPEQEEETLGVSKEHSVLDRIVRGRIVGRQQEFEEARSLWLKAVSGAGQTLLISGEPGIGKTRLMREIVTYSEVTGGRVLLGEAFSESNAPYGAMAQIVHKALASKNGLNLPDLVLDDLLDLAPELRPYYPDVATNSSLDPESEQRRLFENMVSFCSALSERSPLLLVLDDAHWADGSSIALFQHLARRTQKQPVMLLATYREVELREARPFNEMLLELNRQRLGNRIKLSRLNKEETRDLLSAIFDEEITPEFLNGVYRETEGNPFFIEEVCRSLVESGKLYYADGQWHRPNMDELDIPQGVQVAIESRLMKLPEEVQDTLRLAAVIGREFDYEVLIEASDLDEDSVIDAIEMADKGQMVQEGGEETLYEFVHALVPQSIRENTHRLRRRRLHKRVAAAFETVQPNNYEALAYHHGEGGNEEQALHYYRLAGQRALDSFANQDAENYIIAALNLTDDSSDRASLLSQLGEVQTRLGQHAKSVENLQEAIAILLTLGELDEAARLYAFAGRVIWESGDVKGDLDLCRQGLKAVEGAPDGPGLAHLYSEMARACYFNGVHDEVREYSENALQLADKFDLVEVRTDTLITLGTFMGDPSPDAIPLLEEAVELAEASNLIQVIMRGSNNLGVLYGNQGNYQAAIASYEKSVDFARQTGQISQQIFYTNNVIWSLMFIGQLAEVEKAYEELKPLIEQLADPEPGARVTRGSRGTYLFFKGHFDEAETLIDKNIEEESAANDLYGLLSSYNGKGLTNMIIGNFMEAERAFLMGVEVAEQVGEGEYQYLFASTAASRLGKVEQAKSYFKRALEMIGEDPPIYWREIHILRAKAYIHAAHGQWDAAWSKFGELADLINDKQTLGIYHWLMVEWAEHYLLRAEPDDIIHAQDILEQARGASVQMGADGWVKLIDEKLLHINNGL